MKTGKETLTASIFFAFQKKLLIQSENSYLEFLRKQATVTEDLNSMFIGVTTNIRGFS